ncbi:hypothetical protein NLO74_01280 [Pseudomonas tremae]|nr:MULTISPECIES: magnesium chelatase domain-containing protein [Pseudomonas syringae group]MCQ3017223.1 hypothetical protein [Pseudomonas tremae]MCQ3024650.1 hypothetical protein [Pseudomonas tremae]
MPKDGVRFDIAIALGLMVTSGQMPLVALQDVECLGEQALWGAIRPFQECCLLRWLRERTLIIPAVNTEKACLVSGVGIAVNHLLELVVHFNENAVIAPSQSSGLLH